MIKHSQNILIVGLTKDQNYGDPIICKSVEFLILQENPKANISYACLDEYDYKNWFIIRIINKLQKTYNIHPSKILNSLYRYYFKHKLKNIDLIVLAGGGLIKFKNQYFNGLSGLLDVANRMNIPVAFNGVGIEGFDKFNKKCKELKRILNLPAVKYISTRDDINTLKVNYFNDTPSIPLTKISDPAIYIGEAYNIIKEKSDTIGIGVIRFSIFQEYGGKQSALQIKSLYENIIDSLINEGKKVELFTNGSQSDNKAAKILHSHFKSRGADIKLSIPNSPKELVKIIASFKVIIAARMHACIIAYSLDIPVVGLIWNNKILHWAQTIKEEKYFHRDEQLNSNHISSSINEILNTNRRDNLLKIKLKEAIRKNIQEILSIHPSISKS